MARGLRDDYSFGSQLRRHREARGLTQEALAARSGVSAVGISMLERGERRNPRRVTVDLLARALGLTGFELDRFYEAAQSPRRIEEEAGNQPSWPSGGSGNGSPDAESSALEENGPPADTSPGKGVFISYSGREGAEVARRLAAALKEGSPSFTVFLDTHDVRPGRAWDSQVEKIIDRCSILLFVATSESVRADSYCRDEVIYARNLNKQVIPLLVARDVKLPVTVTRLPNVDLRTDFEGGITQLRAAMTGWTMPARNEETFGRRFLWASRRNLYIGAGALTIVATVAAITPWILSQSKPRSALAPIPSVTSVAFDDDFRTDVGWANQRPQPMSVQVRSGALELQVQADQISTRDDYLAYPGSAYDAIRLEATMRTGSDKYLGISCRHFPDAAAGYDFWIAPSGEFSLDRRNGGGVTNLLSGRLKSTWNPNILETLTAFCVPSQQGTRLVFVVNGQRVADWSDQTRPSLMSGGVVTRLQKAVNQLVEVTHFSVSTVAKAGPSPASNSTGLSSLPADTTQAMIDSCAAAVYKAGYPSTDYPDGANRSIVVALAVGLATSGCNPSLHNSYPRSRQCPNGSVEFGVWQIDSCYRPTYQQSCLLDEQCGAMVAYQISSHGLDWTHWPAYRNGTYLRYVPAANAALSTLITSLRSGSDGTCLEADPSSSGDGAAILHVACSGTDPYQNWRIQEVNGVMLLQNGRNHECLDANGSDGSDGAAIFQWDCDPADNHQHWVLRANDTPDVSAGAALRNVGNETCLSLARSGQSNRAVQWTCSSADPREQWG